MFVYPTVAEFKARFVRDWSYGTTPQTVQDVDIQNAIQDAQSTMPVWDIWCNQAEFTNAVNYLIAHHLVTGINMSTLGMQGQWNWLTEGKSVGEVAENYVIPEWIKENKVLAYLTTTKYGAKFCSIIAPRMVGNVRSAYAPNAGPAFGGGGGSPYGGGTY